MSPSLTLVIAVYNAERYLEYILAALERQTFRDFEVIVADDGSGPEIGAVVEQAKGTLTVPIRHLWQPDGGFRKNVMLNRAIGAAAASYLVFIDGDCLPHRKFLADHWNHHRPGRVLCGRRVNLSREMTGRLTLDAVRTGAYEKLSVPLLWDGLLARSSNLEDAIRIESQALRNLVPRNRARILGCNFSVEKRLLEGVNGFNEDYHAPGIGEDTDIAFRLGLGGASFCSLRYLAALFHLYHPATAVGEANRTIFEGVVARRERLCRHGLANLDQIPSRAV